ncbi:uncharacterized protein LOC111362445 isoform X3 [Spodoptera litura]|uniref:Uncharacterized protein LOC111354456 isoform X3 n=1 Tax=Spodoptera litura TaxID=69820 RepID=A0A9J7ETG2_SPOLT|nr:uncharacterized protein LOC111354456 isoform X3 [Spodoptera litura]XP_022834900.1 uncharacterized protein LOC111362445 isoform X3 [Spodoptera litura]
MKMKNENENGLLCKNSTSCTYTGGELDQEPDQSVLEVDRNDRLDSDLTDCEDLGCELDQEVDIPVVDAETNNELNNVGPHDSDLIEGGDLKTNDKRSRKKKRQPEKWQKNVKKSLKNSGESYQTVKGNTIPAKKLKPPCSTDCRLKCTEKINEEKRLNIFNDFWGIGDLGRQRYFVASCMGVVKPKYSLHREDSKRSLNVSYKFTINSEEIRVCKRFFMATLDIGHSFLSTVNKKKASGIIPEDRRGRHGNTGRCLPQADKDGAREHINSYPRKESHYCRASSTKEYLDGDLNLTMMYRQYKEWCHQNSKPIIKQGTYEHIFRNEFNIAFHKPKKDQCSICLSYQNAVGDDKLQLKYTYEKHLKERDLCRLEKKSDIETCKNDANKIICCYDMQAVLQTPCGNDSLFFYKRRLNVYNCTVFNVVSKAAYCYLWNESLGGKGCDEVGTCIYKFLKDHCVGKNVFFYTDNCSAQNKNKYLLSLYHYAIKVLGVVSITHKYLVIGHTQNEGDSVHSTIEREKTRILKNGSIFVPTQWKSVIQCAKKCGTPYEVHELDFSDILDLKDLVTQFGKNFTVNNDGDRVVWNEIKKIYMQASSPYLVFYNDTYEPNSTMKCLNVRNRTRGRSAANVELHLRNKYHQRPKISNLKKKDLLALCDSNVIPRVYREYYSSLEAGDNHIEPDEHNEND